MFNPDREYLKAFQKFATKHAYVFDKFKTKEIDPRISPLPKYFCLAMPVSELGYLNELGFLILETERGFWDKSLADELCDAEYDKANKLIFWQHIQVDKENADVFEEAYTEVYDEYRARERQKSESQK